MPKYLDLATWPRREVFEFFLEFDKPYFNVCIQLDVTSLLQKLRDYPDINPSLGYHYVALRAANETEPFRYRLKDRQVIVHDVINCGTTLLLPNGTFTLVYFDYDKRFRKFVDDGRRAIQETLSGDGGFRPLNDDARIHCTVLPWFSFTSFSHARNWKREDSIPKVAFGKFTNQNGRTLMPFSIEVHHALMDGLDVGRYLARVEELLRDPSSFVE